MKPFREAHLPVFAPTGSPAMVSRVRGKTSPLGHRALVDAGVAAPWPNTGSNPVGAATSSGPRRAGGQAAVGTLTGKPVPAGAGRDDRREGHPVDEEGAQHLAPLRELLDE